MTQPLRTMHRRIMIVLAVVLPPPLCGLARESPRRLANPGIHWSALERP